MRRAHLIFSGLVQEAAIDLPALEALLARGRDRPGDFRQSPCQRLARLFAPDNATDISLASARMAYDGLSAGDDRWLCADPVHLRLMRDHLLLGDAHTFELDDAEASALVEGLNTHFRGRIEFIVGAPHRWYARLAGNDQAETGDPLDARLARPVEHGDLRWGRGLPPLLTEIQMHLHAHPVNAARESRGQDPINSLWLWGHGQEKLARAPADLMLADGIHGAALAGAAGMPYADLDATAAHLANPTAATLICVESTHALARYGLIDALRQRLRTLEASVFAPLFDALRRGRLDAVDIEVLGYAGYGRHLHRWDAWKFWRR